MADLFGADEDKQELRPGMILLRNYADAAALLPHIEAIATAAPFRHMTTPGGYSMSVAMTCCGALGWVTDRTGYRYSPIDPDSGKPWPPLPQAFFDFAARLAEETGFGPFAPDSGLINRYSAGSRLTAHQDADERDYTQPVVSISLGLPATFFVNLGDTRAGKTRSVNLENGDVLIWGGPARLAYHGIRPLKPGHHPLTGPYRINITLRRAG
jgi:alkylated DNA repair protein (DNA oxidative demethylase)